MAVNSIRVRRLKSLNGCCDEVVEGEVEETENKTNSKKIHSVEKTLVEKGKVKQKGCITIQSKQ